MASYLDKFKVKVGITDNTKLDLSCLHITTTDFMKLSPVYIKEMVPGEKLVVSQLTFTRMAPMPVPTFGRANVHNRGFFVPMRTIFPGWNDFITDTTHVGACGGQTSGNLMSVPTITLKNIVQALISNYDTGGYTTNEGTFGSYDLIAKAHANASTTAEFAKDTNGSPMDFSTNTLYTPVNNELPTYDASTQLLLFNWNSKGRQVVKILESLGYKITGASNLGNRIYSAMPLLAFLKVYIDWYYPAQYFDDLTRTLLDEILNYDNPSQPLVLGPHDLYTIFNLITFVNYDSDYFVSAFDNPDGPSAAGGGATAVSMPDITNYSNTVDSDGNNWGRLISSASTDSYAGLANTPSIKSTVISNKYGPLMGISQYALNALHALTDYMKRHQLVGARAMDRYLARFGKNLSSDKLKRSLYLNHLSFPLQFGDVMSQADTASNGGDRLGDYAGKGLGYGEGRFEYDTDEYGYFIICNSIVPTVGYCQGFDRLTQHINRLDFWTPEFDQLGNQAIMKGELYVNTGNAINTIQSTQAFTGVFGWTPRYSEYKIGRDRLTGDYNYASISQAGATSKSWHMMRMFTSADFGNAILNMVHSKALVQGEDSKQYNRIFYTTNDYADHFYVIHNFDVVSWSPMVPLYDTYKFEDDDKGKKVTADVNGVKVN